MAWLKLAQPPTGPYVIAPPMMQNTVDARPKRVLIVEDDLELVQIYEMLLRGFNYDVVTATDGTHAIKVLREQEFDAILCDLQMPELDGDLLYQSVERSKPELCRRFIFITGVGDNPVYQGFLSRLQNPVLHKPVHPARVLEELRKVA